MTTPADAALAASEILAILDTIKELTARKEALQTIIGNAIDLGELDDCLLADDHKSAYILDNIRCCVVRRSTWEYDLPTRSAIKTLQEQSKVEGHAIEKVSVSYRFTAVTETDG